MSKPRLKAEVHDVETSDYTGRFGRKWWVRVSYVSNGKIHSHSEDYNTKRAAINALHALGDGVEVVEP